MHLLPLICSQRNWKFSGAITYVANKMKVPRKRNGLSFLIALDLHHPLIFSHRG